jgi:hypothetical protein
MTGSSEAIDLKGLTQNEAHKIESSLAVPAKEAVNYFRTRALLDFARGQRPVSLFDAEKQQKTSVQAVAGRIRPCK